MLAPDSLDLHLIGDVLQAALQGLATLHQVLDVEYGGEVLVE